MLKFDNIHVISPVETYLLRKKALKSFNLNTKNSKDYILRIRPHELSNNEWLNYIDSVFKNYSEDTNFVYCVKMELLFKDTKFTDYFVTTIFSFFYTLKSYYDLLATSNAVKLTVFHANKEKVLVLMRKY